MLEPVLLPVMERDLLSLKIHKGAALHPSLCAAALCPAQHWLMVFCTILAGQL